MGSRISYLWSEPGAGKPYRSGVSIHSHTNFSHETLSFIPRAAEKMPFLREAILKQEAVYLRYHGTPFEFAKGYWTPPLTPTVAVDVESKQIEALGLGAMVSITDHDGIGANLRLHSISPDAGVPISVEWTVPVKNTFFHFGIHNLPVAESESWMARLAAFTARGGDEEATALFEALNAIPEVLVVFNHPLWDENEVGQKVHNQVVEFFLGRNNRWIHALELNGLRPRKENSLVVHLAERWNQPVVSGGDRHGREPNALINLTNASTFTEWVGELRTDRQSHVLFMPQYNEPFALRVMQTLLDVLRDYPDYPAESRSWHQRVFYEQEGVDRPLSYFWPSESPFIVKHFVRLVHLLQSDSLQSALRYALSDGQSAHL